MKFLIDNNLPPGLASALNELASPFGDTVVHLRRKFAEDVADIQWMSALSDEGGWAAVTQDRLSRNPAERAVLRKTNLTAFILARGWGSLEYWEKAWRLVRWWPSIAKVAGHSIGVYEVPLKFRLGKLRQIVV